MKKKTKKIVSAIVLLVVAACVVLGIVFKSFVRIMIKTTLKTILLLFYSLWAGSLGFAAYSDSPAFEYQATTPDTTGYVHATVVDEGVDIYSMGTEYSGYHYGPSMILNSDDTLDVWFAAAGTLSMWDFIAYRQTPDFGKTWTDETIAISPTAGGEDELSNCDPGVIKIGDYYYIGYTSTLDERGTDNNVYVGRSKDPAGPYEKWTGDGWGTLPKPIVEYKDDPDHFGIGEPSFVLLNDVLYIYYSYCGESATTCVATADATDENWPATMTFHGTCIPAKDGGDSSDVKYSDEYGRFIAVFTEKRFSDESYIALWESFDGINFRKADEIKQGTAKCLHNCGISGRSDGHIGKGDKIYLAYAYSGGGVSWAKWATRMQRIELSLEDSADDSAEGEENVEMIPSTRKTRMLSDVSLLITDKMQYNVKHAKVVNVLAFDSDGYTLPVLGVKFDGYDTSIIKMVGRCIIVVGKGTTRVTAHWQGFSCEFVVSTED